MSEKLPETLDELRDYITKYADDIIVFYGEPKKVPTPFSEISSTAAVAYLVRWLQDGIIPTRMVRDNPAPVEPAPNQWFAGCSTRAEIEARYRELAMEHHPDRNGGEPGTMAEINEAKALAMQAVSE